MGTLLHTAADGARRPTRWARRRPVIALWVVAFVANAPGLWRLLPDFADDPDMRGLASKLVQLPLRDLPKLLTDTAPWGDGSYRPVVALSWWLDGAVWGLEPRGWAFTNWLFGVGATAFLGMVVRRLSGRDLPALLAVALAGLRQSVQGGIPSHVGALLAPCAGLVSVVWLIARWPERELAGGLGAIMVGWGIVWVVVTQGTYDPAWVPWYVGGRTALMGALLQLGAAYAALVYAETAGRGALGGFWALWALMALTYEQPLCLPVAFAPAFLVTVPRERWRRALPPLAGAAALGLLYGALRWHLLQVHGASDYQMMQLRSGCGWIGELADHALPPLLLCRLLNNSEGLWSWALPGSAGWLYTGHALAWLWAYGHALTRNRLVQALYFWRVVALLPLILLHPMSHYYYLPQLAGHAALGLVAADWVERRRGKAGAGTTTRPDQEDQRS